MLDGPRYELPRGAQFFMILWTVVWPFLSIAVAGNSGGLDIGGAVLLWVVGSLIGSALIVGAMGGMQEKRDRDVFGAARFADDRKDVERAGLKGSDA